MNTLRHQFACVAACGSSLVLFASAFDSWFGEHAAPNPLITDAVIEATSVGQTLRFQIPVTNTSKKVIRILGVTDLST